MKLSIGSDHAGYNYKQEIIKYLEGKGHTVIDCGTNSLDSCDYPIFGRAAAEKVANKEVDYGIAICGSAIGISIACNKVKGIRCGKINTEKEAIHAKTNDFVNIIALSGETPIEENIKIIEAYINAKENKEDPAYLDRINQITRYENER